MAKYLSGSANTACKTRFSTHTPGMRAHAPTQINTDTRAHIFPVQPAMEIPRVLAQFLDSSQTGCTTTSLLHRNIIKWRRTRRGTDSVGWPHAESTNVCGWMSVGCDMHTVRYIYVCVYVCWYYVGGIQLNCLLLPLLNATFSQSPCTGKTSAGFTCTRLCMQFTICVSAICRDVHNEGNFCKADGPKTSPIVQWEASECMIMCVQVCAWWMLQKTFLCIFFIKILHLHSFKHIIMYCKC